MLFEHHTITIVDSAKDHLWLQREIEILKRNNFFEIIWKYSTTTDLLIKICYVKSFRVERLTNVILTKCFELNSTAVIQVVTWITWLGASEQEQHHFWDIWYRYAFLRDNHINENCGIFYETTDPKTWWLKRNPEETQDML